MRPDDEDFLTLEDVLREATRIDLDLTERTFRYYSVLGLLPRPIKRAQGDARIHYYPRGILTRLQDIRKLQNEGYSLKQIKGLGATPGAEEGPLPAGRPGSPAHPGSSGYAGSLGLSTASPAARPPALAFLRSFAQQLPKQAAQRFLARTTANPDEEGFRDAALDYCAELLAMVVDPAEARTSVREAASALSPAELERLLSPLREWRDRESTRPRPGGPPITRRLRQLALDKLLGNEVATAELEGHAGELARLALQAKAQEADPDPLVQRASRNLAAALERLSNACLLGDPAAALGQIELAERSLTDTDQLLRLYAGL